MKPTPSLMQRLVYPVRVTIAALLALLAAHVLGFREVYWAAVSAIIVVQSDFGASLLTSWHRLVGTALGAAIGAALAECAGRSVPVYGLGVLCVGVLSAALRLDQPANRFGAVAFTIVFLLVGTDSAWAVAFHRFVEVSTGIVAGLILSAGWPEQPMKRRPAAESKSTGE